MFGIGFPELVVIFLVAIVLIRPEDLPAFFRALGRAYAKAKKTYDEVTAIKDDFVRVVNEVAEEEERKELKAEPVARAAPVAGGSAANSPAAVDAPRAAIGAAPPPEVPEAPAAETVEAPAFIVPEDREEPGPVARPLPRPSGPGSAGLPPREAAAASPKRRKAGGTVGKATASGRASPPAGTGSRRGAPKELSKNNPRSAAPRSRTSGTGKTRSR